MSTNETSGNNPLGQGSDPLLQMLFNLGLHGISLRVSLLIEGTYVQGNIISSDQYLQRNAAGMREANVLGSVENIPETLASLFEAAAGPVEGDNAERNFITDRSDFFHLSDVSVFSSSNARPMRLKEMRVRASSVNAFSLSTHTWEA